MASAPAAAQSAPVDGSGAWNSPRALELVRAAQDRRSEQILDEELRTYQARGRAAVQFIVDHPSTGRENLVRTDQVALDLLWRAPNHTRQHIVGWTQREELPVRRLHYYLDRLTVVQDNFGDGIVIADGDNVDQVPHPAAPGSELVYDFRLADSVTLRLGGVPEPLPVYELAVRPKDQANPGVIGSIFVDGRTGALVRMRFTFTRAAYVDPRLDRIDVILENGLWEGRYWLPYEQRLEIRRELPELDFGVGTIIRTHMRVGDYVFNEELPLLFLDGQTITAAPRAQREAYPFEERDAEMAHLLPVPVRPAEAEALRAEARAMLTGQLLSGLPRSRLGFSGASDLFRFNRAEGAVLGFGGSFLPVPGTRARVHAGWAFGAAHPLGRLELTRAMPGGTVALTLGANQPNEVGLGAAASPGFNTLSALVTGADFTDPYASSGLALRARQGGFDRWVELGGRLEHQRSFDPGPVRGLAGDTPRAVRQIDDGTLGALSAAAGIRVPAARGLLEASARLEGGRLAGDGEDLDFSRSQLDLGWERDWDWRRGSVEIDASTGAAFGTVPRQSLFLLGGRGTVPGHAFREYGGDRFALATLRAGAEVQAPWLRLHALAAAGWADAGSPAAQSLARWGGRPTQGLLTSLGAGVGLFYDLVRLEAARGFGSRGRWQFSIEARPEFWGWM